MLPRKTKQTDTSLLARAYVCRSAVVRIETRDERRMSGSGTPFPTSPWTRSSSGGGQLKLLSPDRRRACIDHVIDELAVSERRACRVLGQHSTQREIAKLRMMKRR